MDFTFTSCVITAAICSGILYIVMWYLPRRHFYKLASKFGGPPVLPVIGNAHLFAGSMEHILSKLHELNESYPSPFRLWLVQYLVICVNDPEQIKMVCLSSKTLERGLVFKKLSLPFLGTGILTAPVPKWKVHRKLIQPTFNAKILDSFVKVFATQSKILTNRLKRNLDGPEFELFELISLCTLDMICGESKSRRKAFLDHLIKLSYGSENLSDESLRAEVDTMVFAGNETTALVDSFAMLMLASHPEIQEKVYQELYEIYGNDDIEDHPVTSKDLPHMKYLGRVIRETMRLFPPASDIVRMATDDLDIGDHTVPSGSLILIGILSIHRNEKYWPEPLKFNPDRFLPKEISKRHPYAYMPFGAGPRNCIGLNYAMMAMKTLIATILRRYILKKDDIVPVKDIRLKLEMILKPVDPIKLRIESRMKN